MATKLDQMKGYVEPALTAHVRRFADDHGMTKSQAVRHLVIQGLKLERKRKEMAQEAEAQLCAPPAVQQSLAS